MRSIGTARAFVTTSASNMYIEAARRFSERATVFDDPAMFDTLDKSGKHLRESELVDSVLAAVLTANSAVEAVVNELFVEQALFPGNSPWFKGLSDDVGKAFADAWKNGVERYELVTKCQIATAIAGKERLDFGAGSAQRLQRLIDLRNALIHHKPVALEHGKRPHESDDALERKLNGQFELSRICPTHTFRWYGCLGAGCAKWAYETATAFERDFFAHLGATYLKP
jgi:hypothetical protein